MRTMAYERKKIHTAGIQVNFKFPFEDLTDR